MRVAISVVSRASRITVSGSGGAPGCETSAQLCTAYTTVTYLEDMHPTTPDRIRAAFLVEAADPVRQNEPHPAIDLIVPAGASDASEIERQLSAKLRAQTRRRRRYSCGALVEFDSSASGRVVASFISVGKLTSPKRAGSIVAGGGGALCCVSTLSARTSPLTTSLDDWNAGIRSVGGKAGIEGNNWRDGQTLDDPHCDCAG